MARPLSIAPRNGFRSASRPGARRPKLRLIETPATFDRIDSRLLSLGRREARCRLLLGRLAAVFLKRSAHHRLGFARLGDYTRERLGLSGREVQGLASVASRLGSLPVIAAAFSEAALSWSHVRLLASIASRESEAVWLERARGATVRGLLRTVREQSRNGGAGSDASDGGDMAGLRAQVLRVLDDESGTIDGEETVRLRLRCPARTRVLWRRAVELARRMLGTQAPVWQAAEAIAAEGLAAGPAAGASDTDREAGSGNEQAPSGRFGNSAANCPDRVGSDRTASSGDEHTPLGFPGGSAVNGPHCSVADRRPRETGRPTAIETCSGASIVDTAHSGMGACSAARPGTTARSSDPELDLLEEELADPTMLDAFALDERMREIVAIMRQTDAALAKSLRHLLRLGFHRNLGFASFDDCVRERYGISPSRAWALVRIDRKADEVPALASVWQSGAISWVRVQTILPVLSGADAARWIQRAGEVTVRRLAREIEQALETRDLQMCARRDREKDPAGESDPNPADGNTAAEAASEEPAEMADGEVTFRGPVSVVGLFRDAVTGSTRPGEPSWKGLERLLVHVLQEWGSQPRHRDPVFEREGWRCAVPACSSRRNLHDHHRQFRSRGGTNERSNRVAVCAWHHLRGIHGGLVHVQGHAPDGLRWALGLRAERSPLMVLDGDRYRTAL